jgi:hypothetical protein
MDLNMIGFFSKVIWDKITLSIGIIFDSCP